MKRTTKMKLNKLVNNLVENKIKRIRENNDMNDNYQYLYDSNYGVLSKLADKYLGAMEDSDDALIKKTKMEFKKVIDELVPVLNEIRKTLL